MEGIQIATFAVSLLGPVGAAVGLWVSLKAGQASIIERQDGQFKLIQEQVMVNRKAREDCERRESERINGLNGRVRELERG